MPSFSYNVILEAVCLEVKHRWGLWAQAVSKSCSHLLGDPEQGIQPESRFLVSVKQNSHIPHYPAQGKYSTNVDAIVFIINISSLSSLWPSFPQEAWKCDWFMHVLNIHLVLHYRSIQFNWDSHCPNISRLLVTHICYLRDSDFEIKSPDHLTEENKSCPIPWQKQDIFQVNNRKKIY